MVPRGRGEKSIEAERQYRAGKKLVDIARDMGVPEGTVRRWKSDQDWEGKKRTKKKQSERSETKPSAKPNARNTPTPHTERNHTSKAARTNPGDGVHGEQDSETNTPSPFARPGNRNAAGNKGGPGGPIRNKHALKSGEYETIFFTPDIMDDEERALLDVDYDKYVQQYLLIDTLTIREKRILQRIRNAQGSKSGMVTESATVIKADEKTSYINRDKKGKEKPGTDMNTTRDNSSVISKSAIKRVMELEDALSRVQARKQAAIAQLHRMEMDDERLSLDHSKLEIYKQRISGKIDLDDLIGDDDLDDDL